MLKVDRELCLWCGTCVGVCPTLALTLMETYVEVDHEKCTQCGICVRACPVGALSIEGGGK